MIPEWAVKLDTRIPEINAAVERAMVQTIHETVGLMADTATERAPVGEGGPGGAKHLRDSIRTEVKEEKAEGRVIVGGKKGKYGGYHAFMVEFGTGPHTITVDEDRDPQRKALADKRAGVLYGRVVKHPGTAAQPFMRPAFDENAPKGTDIYRRNWNREVGKAVGRA